MTIRPHGFEPETDDEALIEECLSFLPLVDYDGAVNYCRKETEKFLRTVLDTKNQQIEGAHQAGVRDGEEKAWKEARQELNKLEEALSAITKE